MGNDTLILRDLLGEIISLVDVRVTLSDIHIEQDMPMMIKTPRGWHQHGPEIVTREDMLPLLNAIDLEWEDKTIDAAIDRPFLLTKCRLRCNVYRMS